MGKVLALFSAAALCIYTIVLLIQLRDVLSLLQKNLAEIGQHAKPVLENLEVITEKLKSITTKIDDHVGLVRGSLQSLKNVADNVMMFEQKVQGWLEEPIFKVATIVAGFVNSVTSWIERWKGDSSSS